MRSLVGTYMTCLDPSLIPLHFKHDKKLEVPPVVETQQRYHHTIKKKKKEKSCAGFFVFFSPVTNDVMLKKPAPTEPQFNPA